MSAKLQRISRPFPSDPDVALTDYDVVRSNIYDPQLRDFAIVARLKKAASQQPGGSASNFISTAIDPTIAYNRQLLVIPDWSIITSIEISTVDPVTTPGPPTGIDFEILSGHSLLQPPGYPNLSIAPIYPTWEALALKHTTVERTTSGGGIRVFFSPYTMGTTGGPVLVRIGYTTL